MIVPMPREVDHHVAGNMSREIDLLAESWHVHRIVFDFAGTDFMDSSGIGILIGRKKTMDMHAGKVTAVNLGERVYKIFEKSGIVSGYFIGRGGKIKWCRKIICRFILMQNRK